MDTINKITCPKCNHHFNAEQALADVIEAKLRIENKKFQQEIQFAFDEKEGKLRVYQAKLLKEKQDQDEILKKQLEEKLVEERRKMLLDLQEKTKKENELQVASIKEELNKRQQEILTFKTKEVALMRKEQALEDQLKSIHLDQEKAMLELKKDLNNKQILIEEEAKKKADEQNQMRIREYEKQLDDQKKLIAEMQRKAEQGSMQLQGEVQEMALEDMLRGTFTFDLIEEVGKGVRGADVIHTVRNSIGKECGKIIYESKRTKGFKEEWIDKLKYDLRSQKADMAVLVTETLPKDVDKYGLREGVWMCTFQEIKGVAMILRDSLLRIHESRSAQENRGEKMQMLYDYLTHSEFKCQVEAIVEGFTSMKKGLEKEKRATLLLWKEREKQIEKVTLNTIEMYGSIKGIAGNAVAPIKQLELDQELLEEGD